MWWNVPDGERSPDRPAPKLMVVAGAATRRQKATLAVIPLSKVTPNDEQPRKHFDEDRIAELADSIRERGVIQPVVVRPIDGGYQLLAGERRFRATVQAGLEAIPAIVREHDDPLEIALIENLQREDLSPLEEAEALKGLAERHDYSHKELADLVGKSRPYVSNVLSLLRLPDRVKEEIHQDGRQVSRELLMAVARTADPAEAEALWDRLKLDLVSVRRFRFERSGGPRHGRSPARDVILAARRLSRSLKRMLDNEESVDPSERESVLRTLRRTSRLIEKQMELLS